MPQHNGEAPPPMPNMMPMLLSMMFMLFLYMLDGNDHIIGGFLNYGLKIFSFDGEYPVLTLIIVGLLMATITTVVRSFFIDMIQQARTQHIMSAFNKELRQARIENNSYKLKKLMEMQQTMMAKNMESSAAMMKTMPYTMIVVIPIFLWVRYFVAVTLVDPWISVPWADISLQGSLWFMPMWIVIYSMISIPFGQVLNRLIRGYKFKKKLDEMDKTVDVIEVA